MWNGPIIVSGLPLRLSLHGTTMHKYSKFSPFSDYVISSEKRYQALPAILYCKQRKAGWGLGMRLGLPTIQCLITCSMHYDVMIYPI